MKRCARCQTEKPLDAFHRDKNRPDGLYHTCKACKREIHKARYWADPEAGRQRYRDWYAANSEQERARSHGRRRNHERAKWLARRAVNDAIKCGRMKRQLCEVCGDPNTHGHHDDYSRPLDVRWLCPKHHAAVHAGEAPQC